MFLFCWGFLRGWGEGGVLSQGVTHRSGWSGALGEFPGVKVTGMPPCAHLPSTVRGLGSAEHALAP